MDRLQASILAMVLFALVALAVYPLLTQAADTSVEGENEDPLYCMTPKAITDTVTLAMDDGVLTIDGEAVTGLGLTGSVLLMSDVLTMEIDADTGEYAAWSILLEGSGCKADSTSDPTLVYTFDRAHLTITDSSDPDVSLTSWFRYLLVPSATGDLGVWTIADLPDLVVGKGSLIYVSEASGTHAGTVYGPVGNLAPGQNIVDGARAFGSASAVYGTTLNNTAYVVESLDVDGGIVGDSAYVVCEKTYTYQTQTGFVVGTLLSVSAVLIFLLVLAAIIKVIR